MSKKFIIYASTEEVYKRNGDYTDSEVISAYLDETSRDPRIVEEFNTLDAARAAFNAIKVVRIVDTVRPCASCSVFTLAAEDDDEIFSDVLDMKADSIQWHRDED